MHYADFILSTHGLLSRIWLAAHWDKKLNKNSVISTDIVKSIENILSPNINVALKTTGHLLLGVVKIYSRQTIYLLHDCTEALSIFSFQSKSIKSHNQSNRNDTSDTINRSRKNRNTSNIRSNQSRIEDITLQPPDDFLNAIMMFKELDENFMQDFEHDYAPETMRNFNQSNTLPNDISYEMARDQSMANENDLTNLFDSTELPSFGAGDKPTMTNQSIFSNINMDDFDMDNDNPNDLMDSALNKFTMGDISSINSRPNTMMWYFNDPSKLDQIQLDPLDSGSKSSKSNILTARKRRLAIDPVMFIGENNDEHRLKRFKDIVNDPTLVQLDFPQKENIPPGDSYLSATSPNPLMSMRSNNSILMPLHRHLANLSNLVSSDQYPRQHYQTQNYGASANDNYRVDENLVEPSNTMMDDIDFNNDYDVTSNYDLATTANQVNNTTETDFYDLDKSLEKYDKGDIAWSRNAANMAKQLLHIRNSSNGNVSFQKYLKSCSMDNRKGAAKMFYSLLILQKEGLFDLRQVAPYENIDICPTDKMNSSQFS